MSAKTMDKARLLKVLQAKRKRFEALISGLAEAEMMQPALDGNWSVKDLLAHIAVWDRRGTLWIKTAAEGKVPAIPEVGAVYDPREWARLNLQTFEQNRDRALSDIAQDFDESYEQLRQQIRALRETDISRSFRIEGDVITIRALIRWRYSHWQSHGRDLQVWIAVLHPEAENQAEPLPKRLV